MVEKKFETLFHTSADVVEKKKPLSMSASEVVESLALKEFQSVVVRQPKVDAPSAVLQVRTPPVLLRPAPVRSVKRSELMVSPVVVRLVEVA